MRVRTGLTIRSNRGSSGAISAPTAPDSAARVSETPVFPQEDAKGSSPLSSTWQFSKTPQSVANPGNTGVFFCAGKSACDSLQPSARTCCVVLWVTLRRSFSPVSFVDRSISAARANSAEPGTHFPDISPSIRLLPLQQPHDLLLDLSAQRRPSLDEQLQLRVQVAVFCLNCFTFPQQLSVTRQLGIWPHEYTIILPKPSPGSHGIRGSLLLPTTATIRQATSPIIAILHRTPLCLSSLTTATPVCRTLSSR